MKKNITILLILLVNLFLISQEKTIEQIMKEEQETLKALQDKSIDNTLKVENEFRYFQEQITKEYEEYEKQIADEMKALEDAITKKWKNFRHDTKDEYVDYDNDLNARGCVNFKEGVVEIEVIEIKNDSSNQIDSTKLRLQKKLQNLIEQDGDDHQPLMQEQLSTDSGGEVTQILAEAYSKSVLEKGNINKEEYTAKDGKKRVKYSIKVDMVPDHIKVRAKRYREEVTKQAKRFNIRPSIAFAVMHTESNYNPKARSHVPAFGLMQLVPRSGARDAYNFIYQQDKMLNADYLYIPQNNIELGCAYLSKIRYKYFKNIDDDEKAYYCTISAYNTGAGNVAKAIFGHVNIRRATSIINKQNRQWVYDKLYNNLPYKETRNYLKKVTELETMYHSWN